ncbi:hypothetical protein KIM372_11060 [Bombiscardovia nodaiensis]|uniref:Alcohol dehydrogenase n=1 Tax=Bombiscardovia nodaiensis TaxID=2932181 RepID=A0ABN6SCE4_9BIFI|nr:hypothetical protein KIM372_11060 [Bombiscardovia nodaiensis]
MSGTRTSSLARLWAYLASLLLGALSGLVGTLAHRMGATGWVPYGLIIAFALLIASSYWSRASAGAIGLGLHIIGASSLIWLLMGYGPGGDVLIPIASPAFTNFVDQHAGYIWLLGSLVVQVLMLLLPKRWFVQRTGAAALPAPHEVPVQAPTSSAAAV